MMWQETNSIRFQSVVQYRNIEDRELRKMGFISYATDTKADRHWLVHACTWWFEYTPNEETLIGIGV